MGLESQSPCGGPVVETIVVVPVKAVPDPQGLGERSDRGDPHRVTIRGLVGHQDVRTLSPEGADVGGEDRAVVLAHQSASPTGALAAAFQEILWGIKSGLRPVIPDAPPKDASEARHTDPRDRYYTSVEVPGGPGRAPQVVVIGIRVRVVVARNEPEIGPVGQRREHLIQRTWRLNIPEQDHRLWAMEGHGLEDGVGVAVNVATKKDAWG